MIIENYEDLAETIADNLRGYVEKSWTNSLVMGLSGGVDSAVSAALAAKAIGPTNVYTFHYIKMPFDRIQQELEPLIGTESKAYQREHQIRSENFLTAQKIAEHLRIRFAGVSLVGFMNEYAEHLLCDPQSKSVFGSKVMMSLLQMFAKYKGGLVCGTLNRTELFLGHFTHHSVECYDVNPIGALYKFQIRELAKALGLPDDIVNRPSSGGYTLSTKPAHDLWFNMVGLNGVGFNYADVEPIVQFIFDLGVYEMVKAPEKRGVLLKANGLDPDLAEKVIEVYEQNRYKTETPRIISLEKEL